MILLLYYIFGFQSIFDIHMFVKCSVRVHCAIVQEMAYRKDVSSTFSCLQLRNRSIQRVHSIIYLKERSKRDNFR
jgi:hypothetical protein